MEEFLDNRIINRITIETANNGFFVYVNEWLVSGQISKQSPYVFETMENLLEFIKNSYDTSK
jgi:hypothetical protein